MNLNGRSDAVLASISRDAELRLIEEFLVTQGSTRWMQPEVVSSRHVPPMLSASKRADWQKGKSKSARWRYNLAVSYARNNGLAAPAWTDVLEAELLSYRIEGLSYRKIAVLMGKTKASIQARVRYLRLGRRL